MKFRRMGVLLLQAARQLDLGPARGPGEGLAACALATSVGLREKSSLEWSKNC